MTENQPHNWHSLLGTHPGADAADIKRAFRKRVRQLHPDTNAGDPDAEKKLKLVILAYKELCRQNRPDRFERIRQAYGETQSQAANPHFNTAAFSDSLFISLGWKDLLKVARFAVAAIAAALLVSGAKLALTQAGQQNYDPVRSSQVYAEFQSAGLGSWYERNWWTVSYFEKGLSLPDSQAVRCQLSQYLNSQALKARKNRNIEEAARLSHLARRVSPFVIP